MQFYDSTNKTGIVNDAYFLIFGDSGDHTADYPLADVARNVNRWSDKVVTKILQSDKNLEWDDANKTDLPIANINIASGQNDYGVNGSTYLKISRVEIRDASGNPILLKRFSLDDANGRAFWDMQAESGTPSAYMVRGNSLFFDRTPNYSYTAGLRVFYQRNVDYFTAADTTKTPGFAENYHRILSLGAAYDYAVMAGMSEKAATFRNEINAMEADLMNFYAYRNPTKLTMKPRRDDYGQSALSGGSSRTHSF